MKSFTEQGIEDLLKNELRIGFKQGNISALRSLARAFEEDSCPIFPKNDVVAIIRDTIKKLEES